MNTADKIVSLVDEMRQNSQEQNMWRNIPLAKECLHLLRNLDDPEEDDFGKALACRAVRRQLPEYDVPRFVLEILHYEQGLLKEADKEGIGEPESLDEVEYDIQRLNDYTDIQKVGVKEFMELHDRSLNFDPVERTPQWEEMYYEVQQECDRRLKGTPRGMGFCFAYWSTLRAVLSERGIQWHSPSEMNPRVMFD